MPRISPHPSLLCGVRQISTNVAISWSAKRSLPRVKRASFACRLGGGVAPLHALFFSLARDLTAVRGKKGRGGFTVSLSNSTSVGRARPRSPLAKYRTRPFSLSSLSASFPLLPRDELCSGAPERFDPPAP